MSERAGGVTKAVILARGLGRRMRRADASSELNDAQAAAAESGVKGMIPIGRPFLDYVLSALADAGYREVCLVIGPEHGMIREHYTRLVSPRRVRVRFAEQLEPLGTADAVLAAEEFAAGDPFLVINADNYYPVTVLRALREHGPVALPGFDRIALGGGNIPPERIASFALVDAAPDGTLLRIVEKPDEATMRSWQGTPCVSMNCWLFDDRIFGACRSIAPSERGELELPHAVQRLVDEGTRIRVLPVKAAVLDLSSRRDIPAVQAGLANVRVEL